MKPEPNSRVAEEFMSERLPAAGLSAPGCERRIPTQSLARQTCQPDALIFWFCP
jgi:hypothetical protein